MRINDAVFGLVLILLGGYIFITALGFPAMPGQRFGSALFPKIVGTGFVLCGIALAIAGVRARDGHGWVELGEWARAEGHAIDVALTIGAVVLLILVWNVTGFLIGATLIFGGLIWRYRKGQPVSSFGIALAACILIDIGFRRFLLVPLPLGPLTGIMW